MEHPFVSHSKLLRFVPVPGKLSATPVHVGKALPMISMTNGSVFCIPAQFHAIHHFLFSPLSKTS